MKMRQLITNLEGWRDWLANGGTFQHDADRYSLDCDLGAAVTALGNTMTHEGNVVDALERIEALEERVERHQHEYTHPATVRTKTSRPIPEPDSEPEPEAGRHNFIPEEDLPEPERDEALDSDIQNLQRHAFEAGFNNAFNEESVTRCASYLAHYMRRDTPRIMRDQAVRRLRSRPSEEAQVVRVVTDDTKGSVHGVFRDTEAVKRYLRSRGDARSLRVWACPVDPFPDSLRTEEKP